VNEQIGVSPVRLIDAEGAQVGVVSLDVARRRAREAGLDLVEVSPDARPPVVRLMDCGRYRLEGRRRAGEGEGRQAPLKEVRLRTGIESHEYEFKARHIRRFIDEGYRVAVTVLPDDRTGSSPEADATVLEQLSLDLQDVARAEFRARTDGPCTSMTLAPFTRQ
jgi:translation initiation factor IF-3